MQNNSEKRSTKNMGTTPLIEENKKLINVEDVLMQYHDGNTCQGMV